MTESCILEIVLEPFIPWTDKFRLIDHYKPVVDLEVYEFFVELVFDDMIDELRAIAHLKKKP